MPNRPVPIRACVIALAASSLCGLSIGGCSRPPKSERSAAPTPEFWVPPPPEAGAELEQAPTPEAPAAGAPAPLRSEGVPIGTNLDAVSDWSPDLFFVDVFKRSRDFISGSEGAKSTWDDGGSFELDEHGYIRALQPGRLARSLIIWEQPHYPPGDYTILYEGTGAFEFWPQAAAAGTAKGRRVIRADPTRGGIGVFITSLPKAKDHIRNVRVLMPGGSCQGDPLTYCDQTTPCLGGKACVPFEKTYEKQRFNPKFLQRIKSYSVLRFMDWMDTNTGNDREWKDRPKLDDAHWTHGVPVEVMVELANLMHQHPWFTMSHQADDEYVRQFATYVRDHLDPSLKVYVEYSNEVWNGMFPQAEYAAKQGRKLGLADTDWEAQLKFYARRTRQIHQIWTSVFSGPERLVRVVGSQAGNDWVSETLLEYEGLHKHADALAIAPYFGGEYGEPEQAQRWQSKSVGQLLQDLRTNALDRAEEMMKRHAAVAKKYGLELVAYEGGQHLVGILDQENNEALSKLFDAANRDRRMKQIYLEYLDRWRAAGGKLFVHFNDCSDYNKWGRWGALEHLEQPRSAAPKFDALQTFIEAHSRRQ